MTEDLTPQLDQRIDSEDHQLKTPKSPKTPPCPINGEQLSIENIETIEEEKEALPLPTLIPKPLMKYERFAEMKAKEDEDRLEQEKQNQISAEKQKSSDSKTGLEKSDLRSRLLRHTRTDENVLSRFKQGFGSGSNENVSQINTTQSKHSLAKSSPRITKDKRSAATLKPEKPALKNTMSN